MENSENNENENENDYLIISDAAVLHGVLYVPVLYVPVLYSV